MQPFFITASGTDIGKTLITTTLCWQLRQLGKKVTALKPLITGYDAADDNNDTSLILKSCGLSPTPETMESISPWRFKEQLAPSMAATRDGKHVALEQVVNYCHEHAQLANDILLVEGVGGVMVPLNDSATVLDWMSALNWPIILVTGNYLGSISHTLCSIEVLKARGLALRALVVSESAKSPVPLDDTVSALQKFVPMETPIIKIPRQPPKDELWKTMPLISWICT